MMEKDKLTQARILQLVPEICSGLAYAHEQGIVHRDIRPESILIDRYGQAKLADFGLVKLLDQDEGDWRLTRASQVMGTPQYMAPEQMNRPADVDHRADISSLGMVLYEMLTGDLAIGRFEVPSERVPVDPRYDEIVLKALEREPENRFQRVRELGDRGALLGGAVLGEGNSSLPAAQQGHAEGLTIANIPFSNWIETTYAMRYALGMMGVADGQLVLEWQWKNGLSMQVEAEVHSIRIPLAEVTRTDTCNRWWGERECSIRCNKIVAAGEFPMGAPGVIRVFVNGKLKSELNKFSARLNRYLGF